MAKEPNSSDQDKRLVLRIEPPGEPGMDLSEYGYVVRDLRRVALLAGLMFALLTGLSFLLR
jgi:hypothetical protein